jgi:hypothetical protein
MVGVTLTLPLDEQVSMDDIPIHAVAHLSQVHLRGLVAGRDLDNGTLDLDATADGMTIKGQAQLAGIPAMLDGTMDFRAGPPDGVVQRISASGRAGAGQLAAAGLDAGNTLFGEIPLKATLTERRNGKGDVSAEADLTSATVAVAPLAWRKPMGVAATARARVLLTDDQLRGIDRIEVEGPGLTLRGSAEAVRGRIATVRLARAILGRTDVQGVVSLPEGGPITAALNGPVLDLSAKLTEKTPKAAGPKTEPPPGPAWRLDGRFARVVLAHDQSATDLVVHAENDGRVLRGLTVTGLTAPSSRFAARIEPDAKGIRHLTVSAADAGAVLRGTDLVRVMQGGRLNVTGTYDDGAIGHPLTATAEVNDFRVRDAPALAKLLQALTLYGLADVMKGPGVGFSRLVAPFRLDDDGLRLNDARAFSPSLGLTAMGRIDLNAETADIEGTIVPAYFFNSLLGNIPVVGKLFSPERGGGVFAARYRIHGPLADPSVFVNPLSALTPGFLRELFRIF